MNFPDPTNEDRAARGAVVLAAYLAIEGMDEDNALSDLLADLMHWAEAEKVDFSRALATGQDNYRAEVAEEAEVES